MNIIASKVVMQNLVQEKKDESRTRGTTTWKGRNLHYLQDARRVAEEIGIQDPTIIDLGVGGMVDFIAPFFPEGRKGDFSFTQRLRRAPLKLIDTVARHCGYSHLVSYEVDDVLSVFQDLEPRKIYAVDRDAAALAGVRDDPLVEKRVANILESPLPFCGDIVLCYNLLCRLKDPLKGLENLVAAILPGGILSVNLHNSCHTVINGFVHISDTVYYHPR